MLLLYDKTSLKLVYADKDAETTLNFAQFFPTEFLSDGFLNKKKTIVEIEKLGFSALSDKYKE